ncbi:MAG: 2-amino-4-hydroxy-6-hydroxymethyldihydropteridine diphosphokinase [Kiritimatiellae bacterium]|nr:2-amino-4-hydroxy-6-hydroxymethyldihydropteridine diphosphokinase [Kiritimatiellia bacterium]
MSEIIYIGVGSNIEPERNLVQALDLLRQRIRVVALSTCYRSAALGRPEQAAYINCVWQGVTELDAAAVKFSVLREIEATLGRVRGADTYAAREIDLDLLLYGAHSIHSNCLTIPDPDITRRAFVARPLLELAPEITIPGMPQPLAQMEISQPNENLVAVHDLTTKLKARLQYEP